MWGRKKKAKPIEATKPAYDFDKISKIDYCLKYNVTSKDYDTNIYPNLPWVKSGLTEEQYNAALTQIYKTDFDENGKIINSHYNKVQDHSDNTEAVHEEDLQIGEKIYNEYVAQQEEESAPTYPTTPPSSPFSYNKEELERAKKELMAMVGLDSVKKMILEIVDFAEMKQKRELLGQRMPNQSLNMVFTGNPGTGKTAVAEIVGRIMKALGILKKGHFVSVTKDDLVVDHVGGTPKKTKEVLKKALGGILFIDEAYTLSRGNEQDFGREAIDMIVKYMDEHKGEILIILAGYKKEMNDFWKTNSGLKSRFPNDIDFPDYSAAELVQIAKLLAKTYQVKFTNETEKGLKDLFNKKQVKGRNDSGNGRLVRNELEGAIRKQSNRLKGKNNVTREDFVFLLPSDFAIEQQKVFNLDAELNKIVGNDGVKQHLKRLEANMKIQKMRKEKGFATSGQSLHMIFKGNPGTGKTTVARLVGKILKELEVCKKGHVVEVGRSDLVGQFVGQTAPKVKDKVQEALGGILFIDEAYALSSGGSNDFGKEAIDTLVQEMENHRDELIVILAGYNREMDMFMQSNSGLNSRFPYTFDFKDYTERELLLLFAQMAKQDDYQIHKNAIGPIRFLASTAAESKSNDTGNGRYVRNCIEQAKQHQAMRLSNLGRVPEDHELQMLTDKDFFPLLPLKKV